MTEQKTFNLYCDESTHLEHDGQPYMLYGYVSIASNQIKMAKEQIHNIRTKYNYFDEFKWTNVHTATYPVYNALLEYFFMTDMSFRTVIVDKSQIDNTRKDYTYNDFYFRMYFQLLHNEVSLENMYNVYFDIKDTCSQEKLHNLQKILHWNASIGNFQFIRSHESCFLQIADVLMGAINYNLRVEKGTIKGTSIPTCKLVEMIKKQTNISLQATTPKSTKKFNLFFIKLK